VRSRPELLFRLTRGAYAGMSISRVLHVIIGIGV
jgi:hypothetical protein